MPAEQALENTFDTEADRKGVLVLNAYKDTHPFWIDKPQASGGHPGNPNPGKQGILALHAKSPTEPVFVLRKVTLPSENRASLVLVVSGDPYEAPGRSDFLLQAGVFDGRRVQWFEEKTVDAGTPPSPKNWMEFRFPLEDYRGKTVGLVVKVAYGGKVPVLNEEAFLDAFSVVVEGVRPNHRTKTGDSR
jgi:hypothetical protein